MDLVVDGSDSSGGATPEVSRGRVAELVIVDDELMGRSASVAGSASPDEHAAGSNPVRPTDPRRSFRRGMMSSLPLVIAAGCAPHISPAMPFVGNAGAPVIMRRPAR